jgi:hypothetical protein
VEYFRRQASLTFPQTAPQATRRSPRVDYLLPPSCARENDPPKLRGLGFSLKAAAVQLPAPFDKRVAAARFDDGFDLEARHVVLADDRHLGKLVL